MNGGILKLNKIDLPITCFYDDSATPQISYYQSARSKINRSSGVQIFGQCQPWLIDKPFPDEPIKGGLLLHVGIPEVEEKDGVTVSSPFDVKHGGSTFIYQDKETGGIYGCIIYIYPDAPRDLLDVIWLHELGHSAGLSHDRTNGSIMYEAASGRSRELSDKDSKRLQEAYK